ncbi:hypothetical protein D3C81_1886360 [compost metagenome]
MPERPECMQSLALANSLPTGIWGVTSMVAPIVGSLIAEDPPVPLPGFKRAEQDYLDIMNSIFTVLGILNLLVLSLWWKSFHKRK